MQGHIEIIQKDDVTMDVEFANEDGSPVDLTGGKVLFSVRSDVASPAVISKEITSHTDPTNGKTQISLTSQETESVDPGNYLWGLTFVSANGKRNSSHSGQMVVMKNVND